jgi:uracil-DNA glycosylase family 4
MPVAQMSRQQRAVLAEMGIDVWVSRSAADVAIDDVAPAREDLADALLSLNKEILTCTRCDLHQSRTQAVCGGGNLAAEILVIGEAPGADEDRQGEPFVGPAGQLLTQMLRAIGLDRETVFIANTLKCRPPENRDPAAAEVESCLPFLQRQIQLVQPKLILVVGRIAAHNLLNVDAPIGKLRGQVHHYGEQQIPVVVTYHPAYLLRSPAQKRESWADLLLVQDELSVAAG